MEQMGRIGYEGYCATTNNRSLVSGAPLPPWGGLPENIQNAWNAAAKAILSSIVIVIESNQKTLQMSRATIEEITKDCGTIAEQRNALLAKLPPQ